MKPIVAVVGRPNVGKSTLFNRITRSRDALVDNFPGVTRDRHYGDAKWDGFAFSMLDTGGFAEGDEDPFSPLIRHQVMQAVDEADAIILLLDAKNGISPYDRDMVTTLQATSKPVFWAVNKIDDGTREDLLYDFYALGLKRLYPVSAEHGYGMIELLDDLIHVLTSASSDAPAKDKQAFTRLAVVGRPNVGKSSLINSMLGQQRLLVGPEAGTTRDAIDTHVRFGNRDYLLVDTAGIRRKGKVSRKIEKFSIIKALKSLDRCDVALVVLDSHEGITDQDITVAGYAFERGCGCLFLLNKWDLVDKQRHSARNYYQSVRDAAKFLSFAPILTLSAKTGQRVGKIFKTVDKIYAQYTTRIGTGQINKIVSQATEQNPPPRFRGRPLKFYYTTQVSTRPPTFVSFVNQPQGVHFSYQRFLLNQIRMQTGLSQTPLRIIFRPRTDSRRQKRRRK